VPRQSRRSVPIDRDEARIGLSLPVSPGIVPCCGFPAWSCRASNVGSPYPGRQRRSWPIEQVGKNHLHTFLKSLNLSNLCPPEQTYMPGSPSGSFEFPILDTEIESYLPPEPMPRSSSSPSWALVFHYVGVCQSGVWKAALSAFFSVGTRVYPGWGSRTRLAAIPDISSILPFFGKRSREKGVLCEFNKNSLKQIGLYTKIFLVRHIGALKPGRSLKA
jgi:hypothetical protein